MFVCKSNFLDAFTSISRTYPSKVRQSVTNTFRFPLCRCLQTGPLQSVCRPPREGICFLKAMSNSFQTLIFCVINFGWRGGRSKSLGKNGQQLFSQNGPIQGENWSGCIFPKCIFCGFFVSVFFVSVFFGSAFLRSVPSLHIFLLKTLRVYSIIIKSVHKQTKMLQSYDRAYPPPPKASLLNFKSSFTYLESG